MKPKDTTQDTERNVIDATEALKSKRTRGSASLAGLKLLKKPALEKEESKIIDLYIAARRREQAAAVAADELKPQVLHIVKAHQQIALRGALVSLDHSSRCHYGRTAFEPRQPAQQRAVGRAGGIRTHDLLHPMQARYQTALQPEHFRVSRGRTWSRRRGNASGG